MMASPESPRPLIPQLVRAILSPPAATHCGASSQPKPQVRPSPGGVLVTCSLYTLDGQLACVRSRVSTWWGHSGRSDGWPMAYFDLGDVNGDGRADLVLVDQAKGSAHEGG